MQKGKSLRDKCFFFFSFLYLPTMRHCFLSKPFIRSIKESRKSFFRWWKNGIHVYLLFFFFFLLSKNFYNFMHQSNRRVYHSWERDINENDRVDLIGINSPEVDEIRRWPRTRMERNVNKIFAIKPRYSVDKVDHKREKLGALLV